MLSLGMLISLVITACEGAPKAGGMKQSVDDYHAQRYSQAHQNAAAIQADAPAGTREDAAYLAGLAAYRMGNLDEAERRLMTASRSPNIETAAKSKAMLGEIRMEQRRPRDAAALLVEAYPNLSDDDARHCAYSAAVAYQQSGDMDSARQWLARSGSSAMIAKANPPSPAAKSDSQTRGGKAPAATTSFTLQVGAFHEKNRAKQAADEAAKLADREGLGPVRTVSRRDERGRTMYLVQFGTFVTREAAAAARSRIGKLQYIVTTATSS